MRSVDFSFTPQVHEWRQRLAAFMTEHVYPNEGVFHAQIADGDRWQPTAIVEALKPKASESRAVEPVLAPQRVWRRTHQHRVRAALRDHGALARICRRGLQLLGARHRQHGGARSLWDQRSEETVARAAAGGRNPILLCDDRARRRLV